MGLVMRKVLLSMTLLLGTGWQPGSLHGQDLLVMQWNVHDGLGTIASNSTPQAQALARIVNYNQPDLLLINEMVSHNATSNTAALVDWVTNNVPYLGPTPGASFHVAVSTQTDGYNRNAAISRYPILNNATYNDGLRGLHAFQLLLSGATTVQVFHAHFKCCSDPASADRRQSNAVFAATTIAAWVATNPAPYIMAGDLNEDEANPQTTLTATYHPITTVRTVGGLNESLPADATGNTKTISTTSLTRRFDYILPSANRLAVTTGTVFHSTLNGYTSASPGNLVTDSQTASDHYCVLASLFLGNPFRITSVNPVTWAAVTGKVYRVQYKNGLTDPKWLDLSGDVTATGPSASKTDPTTGTVSNRFYRVLLVQ